MVKLWNEYKMVKWWNGDFMIWCDSMSFGQTCNTKLFVSYSKHLENIRVSDIPYSHALKIHFGSLAEEWIQLRRANKKQQKTLNRVENFLERLCSVNGQQKSYTASTNTYKNKKTYVGITIKDNDTDSIYVNPGVSSRKPFE